MKGVPNCGVCGIAPHIPDPVDGGNHKHYQICCCECGIEVCRLSEAKVIEVWTKLMTCNKEAGE